MIIKLNINISTQELNNIISYLKNNKMDYEIINNGSYYIILIKSKINDLDKNKFFLFSKVEKVIPLDEPFKKTVKYFEEQKTIINVGGHLINDNNLTIIAGPCSVESLESLDQTAKEIKASNLTFFRAGAYKPRSSPYSFQGLGGEAFEYLKIIKEKYNYQIVSEITDQSQLEEALDVVDIIQVGARNMQNFELLKALGKIDKPILLKRGFANTIEEWLLSAEYILAAGNHQVVLCERGIRTFDNTHTRNTLDLSAIPILKKLTHLPVFVDPSHGTGRWDIIEEMSLAAVAAGADGLLIEVHHEPENALSDGGQSLKTNKFNQLADKCIKLHDFLQTI